MASSDLKHGMDSQVDHSASAGGFDDAAMEEGADRDEEPRAALLPRLAK